MEDNVSENGEFETLDKDENSKTKNLPVHDIIDHSSSVSDHSHQRRNHSNYQEYYNNILVRDFPIISRLLGRCTCNHKTKFVNSNCIFADEE